MHIAYFTGTYPALTETFVQREIEYLRSRGHTVSVFALRRADELQEGTTRMELANLATYGRPDNVGLSIMLLPYYVFSHPHGSFRCIATIVSLFREHPVRVTLQHVGYFLAALAFCHYLAQCKIKHIHAHFSTASSIALFCHYLTDVSYSMAAHASADIYVNPVLLEEKLATAKAVIAICDYNRRFLNLVSGFRFAKKIAVVYNGVQVSPPSVTTKEPVDRPAHIVSLAALRIFKGFSTLLQALALVRDKGHNFRCSIVGDGPQRALLTRQIDELRLVSHVSLVGGVENAHAMSLIAAADLFILASEIADSGTRDGIPTVCTEAMALGIPVISTYVSGIPELIEDGQSGLLVPEKHPELLASAIIRLLEDPELRYRLAANGQSRVGRLFNVEVTMPRLEAILQDLAI